VDGQDDLRAVKKALGEIEGTTRIPVSTAVVEKGVLGTPWSPRGLWLLLDTLRRTSGLRSPAGLVARILKGDLTASSGGLLPLVTDLLALAESHARSEWRQCPYGAPKLGSFSHASNAPAPSLFGNDDAFGPLFQTVQLTGEQSAQVVSETKAAENRNQAEAERWEGLRDQVESLPEGEREWVKLALALREVMGPVSYFWTEVVSTAKFQRVKRNTVVLGVMPNLWSKALILEGNLSAYLPKAQAASGIALGITFEKLKGA